MSERSEGPAVGGGRHSYSQTASELAGLRYRRFSAGAGLFFSSSRPAHVPPPNSLAVPVHTWAPRRGAPGSLARGVPARGAPPRPAIFCQGSGTLPRTPVSFPWGTRGCSHFLLNLFLAINEVTAISDFKLSAYGLFTMSDRVLAALSRFWVSGGCNNINKANISTPQISF